MVVAENSLVMKILFLSCFLILRFVQTYSQSDCILKLDKDSVKVYICKVSNSKFKAVKSFFLLRGNLSQIAAMILDIEHHGEWTYKTINSKILKKVSEREIIYYTEVVAPMLISNRDFVIRMTLDQNSETKEIVIDLVSIPDYIPRKKNVVRIPFSKARWLIKPLSSSLLQIDYYIEIDLGGSIPPWIVNMVAPQAPYQTFHNMRKKISIYKNRTVPFISNR